jgi:hypothetical protein
MNFNESVVVMRDNYRWFLEGFYCGIFMGFHEVLIIFRDVQLKLLLNLAGLT